MSTETPATVETKDAASPAGSLLALAGLLLASGGGGGVIAGALAGALASGPYQTGILGGVAGVVCFVVAGWVLSTTAR